MKRRLALSVGDQAVISAFNFALNLFLIKLWTPENFGLFAIVAAAALFTTMIQNAVINTPLAVHLPPVADTDERALLRRVFSAANGLLALLVLLLSGGGLFLWLGTAQLALVGGATLYMGSQFMREYTRGLLATEGRLGALVGVDIAYVVLSSAALAAAYVFAGGQWQTVAVFLMALSAAGLLSIAAHVVPRQWPVLAALPGEMRLVFARQQHEIRWSLLGAVTTDIQNRGYIFVAAAFFGPVVVAHLQAGRIFFGPLGLLTSAWARVARPQLAMLLGRGDVTHFNTLMKRALWVFVAFNVLFMLGLWLAWPYLSALVFSDKYKDLGFLVAAWGVANIAFQIRSCLSIGVQALRRFRELTMATLFGALVSVALVALACAVNESTWLIASVIGGECVAVLVVIRILRRPAAAEPIVAPLNDESAAATITSQGEPR